MAPLPRDRERGNSAERGRPGRRPDVAAVTEAAYSWDAQSLRERA